MAHIRVVDDEIGHVGSNGLPDFIPDAIPGYADSVVADHCPDHQVRRVLDRVVYIMFYLRHITHVSSLSVGVVYKCRSIPCVLDLCLWRSKRASSDDRASVTRLTEMSTYHPPGDAQLLIGSRTSRPTPLIIDEILWDTCSRVWY